MTDGEPKLFGGIEHIEGDTVNAVTDPLGPVNIGSGPQYNVQSAFFTGMEFVRRPQRSPRLIAEDWLSELARRFAAPRSFDRLRRLLREPGTLLIAGEAGTGRRTAALMLLRSSGAGTDRFRELPDEAGEDSKVVLDSEATEPGERLLLDLSGGPDGVVGSLRRELVDYHSAVLRAGAYLVVVLPENAEHEVPEELRQLVARTERPDGATVLRRHLIANGVEPEAGAFEVVGLVQHLESNPIREIAQLAFAGK